MSAKPIPDGFHTVTPHMMFKDIAAAMKFYEKAFNAQEVCMMPGPGGSIIHGEMKIGDSIIMMAGEMPGCEGPSSTPEKLGGTTVTISLYVDDVDKWHERAVQAGAKSNMEPADMFWGDRYASICDPFGHCWGLATHKEDLTPEQIGQRMQEAFGAHAQA